MYKIIVAVSEYPVRQALKSFLEINSYSVVEANNGAIAIECFIRSTPAAVILDLKIPDISALQILHKMRELNADTPVILLVSNDEIDTAIEALGNGAYDYFHKPPDIERLIYILSRCIESKESLKKAKTKTTSMLMGHLGSGKNVKTTIEGIETAANTRNPVNIQGESGTGKSLIARLIHNCDTSVRGPFIQFDIGSASRGNRSVSTRIDKLFKQAAGGTIYFKGLQDISMTAQANLISAITQLGDTGEDVRIIASFPVNHKVRSNEKQLEQTYGKEAFTDWLVIKVPPLVKRIEDIPFLASKFIAEIADELSIPAREITKDAIKLLSRYPWPGNIRELKNAIKRAMLTSYGYFLRSEHFYFLQSGKSDIPLLSLKEEKARAVKDTECRAILNALDMTSGHKSMAAEVLGISRKTLWEKLKEYNVMA
ncbi:MAG: response regulator [Nitrospirota bacterium]